MSQLAFLIALFLGSGIVLWIYDKSHFTALGLQPARARLAGFAFGFISSSIAAGVGLYLVAIVSHATLTHNPDFSAAQFLESTLWMSTSVLIEELIFRGALLYVAIRKSSTSSSDWKD